MPELNFLANCKDSKEQDVSCSAFSEISLTRSSCFSFVNSRPRGNGYIKATVNGRK